MRAEMGPKVDIPKSTLCLLHLHDSGDSYLLHPLVRRTATSLHSRSDLLGPLDLLRRPSPDSRKPQYPDDKESRRDDAVTPDERVPVPPVQGTRHPYVVEREALLCWERWVSKERIDEIHDVQCGSGLRILGSANRLQ